MQPWDTWTLQKIGSDYYIKNLCSQEQDKSVFIKSLFNLYNQKNYATISCPISGYEPVLKTGD